MGKEGRSQFNILKVTNNNLNKRVSLTFIELKFLVFERDDWKCRYCHRYLKEYYGEWKRHITLGEAWGRKYKMRFRPTVDHVIPRSKGGGDQMSNLVTCCYLCNQRKGNSTHGIHKIIAEVVSKENTKSLRGYTKAEKHAIYKEAIERLVKSQETLRV